MNNSTQGLKEKKVKKRSWSAKGPSRRNSQTTLASRYCYCIIISLVQNANKHGHSRLKSFETSG